MEIRFLDQKIEMEKCEEGQEIFDLKPLTKEEIAYFIDQYLVRWEDMREALKIARHQKELQRQSKRSEKIEWKWLK